MKAKTKLMFNITTNNQCRKVLYWHDLTNKQQNELRDDYDTIDESIFTIYKDEVYDIGDTMRTNNFGDYWHSYIAWGFDFGMVIHFSDDGDGVVIGTYNG